jgi:hypothetical protein
MANVIHNMSATQDVHGHDNNNDDNIIKYLELNRTRILDLSEKNFENIVEALTNSVIANIANASSFNSTLSLSSCSSHPHSQTYLIKVINKE